MRRPVILALAIGALAAGTWAQAGSAPVRAAITLRDNSRVQGVLLRLTEQQAVFQVGSQERAVPLEQMLPSSLYMLRRQVWDLSKARTHLELGRYCQSEGMTDHARREFDECLRLDKSLGAEVEQARQAAPGKPAPPAAPPDKPATPVQPPEPPKPEPVKSDSPAKPAVPDKPADKPAAQAAPEDEPGLAAPVEEAPKEIVKYQACTPEQAKRCLDQAAEWAKQTEKFCPTVHLVETPHFLIYSAWDRSNDAALTDICERLYQALCQQFDIPVDQNIWVGKCAIYVFWQKDHFTRFCLEVFGRGNPAAAGFCGHDGRGFCFIAMGPARSRNWFFEVLVHEATHAFVSRYLTNRNIPTWVNEGLADYMASTLLTNTYASRKYVSATRQALRGRDPRGVFQGVGLNEFDYGIAQSWVQYLIARDRQAFIQFVRLLKEGAADEQALQQAYKLTHEQLVQQWGQAAARTLR